jgi:hypothetical protein
MCSEGRGRRKSTYLDMPRVDRVGNRLSGYLTKNIRLASTFFIAPACNRVRTQHIARGKFAATKGPLLIA